MPDQPTALARTVAFVTLLQALAVTALEQPLPSDRPARRGDYAQNRWAALRFGTQAELIHPNGRELKPVSELGAELIELVEPAARSLGADGFLAALDPTSSEGERQVAVGERDGLHAVAADLVERSLSSAS
jgi:gamma-glutamyl:cysteine ligase YbdK (ATP-grasp superfamily)